MITLKAAAYLMLALHGGTQQEKPDFQLKYLAIHGRRQDTVVFDFDGDGRADLVNTAIDYDVDPPVRWFFLHLQRDNSDVPAKPDFVWKISDRASAMVYGDFAPGGGHEIAFIAPDGVYYYPWNGRAISETPRKLLHRRTFFSKPPQRSIPIWWWPHDLDGNGMHDLVLPVADGYRVYFQTEPGVYTKVAVLEADLANAADRALATSRHAAQNEHVAALFTSVAELPRVAVTDIDGNGLQDLVSISGEVLTIFFQREARAFSSRRDHRVRFPVASLREKEKKDTVSISLVQLTDIDGDGLSDLMVTKIQGMLGFLESIKTNIFIHRGTGRGNFVADFVIKIDGISIDPSLIDMNGDGALDCMVSRLRTDILAQAVKAAVLGDIAISYEVFQFDRRSGRYVETPVYTRDVFVPTGDLTKKGAAAVPVVYVRGDHSGDGRPDLVRLNPKNDHLEMFEGMESAYGSRRFIGFGKAPFWQKKLSRYPKYALIYDMNGDAIADVLLLHHGTVGLVLSRPKK
ncbi:MAG: FG-GAP repeat domain-containing protein [Planctomycetota bacterium]